MSMNEPPPYVAYPRQQQWANFGRVRIEVIGEAWKMIQANMGSWAGIGLVSLLIAFVPTYALSFALMLPLGLASGKVDSFGQIISLLAVELFLGLVSIFFANVANGLAMNAALAQIKGQPCGIGSMFDLKGKFGKLCGLSALMAVLTLIGCMLCYLPGLIFTGLSCIAIPILLNEDLSVGDALRKSIDTLKPQMWMSVALVFIVALAYGLGAIACCIGVVFTYGLLPLSYALTYRDFLMVPSGTAPTYSGPMGSPAYGGAVPTEGPRTAPEPPQPPAAAPEDLPEPPPQS